MRDLALWNYGKKPSKRDNVQFEYVIVVCSSNLLSGARPILFLSLSSERQDYYTTLIKAHYFLFDVQ